jgi:putative transposase
MLTDGKGMPLSVAMDGANSHDKTLVKETLDAITIQRPSNKAIQNMCMDKVYDSPDIGELVNDYDYTTHIKRHGEEYVKIPCFEQEGGL